MEIILFTLILSPWAPASFDSVVVELSKKQQKMIALMAKAKECVPSLQLCTGLNLTEKNWSEVKAYDLSACQKAIESSGFKLLSADSSLAKAKHGDFVNSTQRAQTIYESKLVLFKPTAFNRIDCLHELVHIWQHQKTLKSELSPHQRQIFEEDFIQDLNRAVSLIEKAEKKNLKTDAQAMSEKLSPLIEFMQSWQALDHWLDEKDVHYLIYSNCDELKCQDVDFDIALTNLYRLKTYFPKTIALQIERKAHEAIRNKEVKAIALVQKEWMQTNFDPSIVEALLQYSWEELFKFLKMKGLKIERAASSTDFKAMKEHVIPSNLFNSLPLATVTSLRNSKLERGEAFAKFLPAGNGIILVNSMTTKTSIVHEYLHSLQTKTNPLYLEALQEGARVGTDFSTGRLSREVYEEKTLRYNGLIWMGEFEVYQELLKHEKFINQIENLNNRELYQFYQKKLGRKG